MSTPSTSNVKLGVCTVFYNGVDLGYTQGGVEVSVATTTHDVVVDQFGLTPIGELITGRTVTAKVPLAETTLDNLVAIMPGTTLHTDGVKASGITTVSTVPATLDGLTVGGTSFLFKTAPVGPNDMPIPATVGAGAIALANKINFADIGVTAVAVGATVVITAEDEGVAGNAITTVKAGATSITPAGATLLLGADATKKKVVATPGVSINLLDVAQTLVLRPSGTFGAEDFTIFKAATPGALTFAYKVDAERIFTAMFKGYVDPSGNLFALGDTSAA